MFPFSREPKDPQPEAAAPAPKQAEAHPLDGLTGGVFSAATSGERAQRVRDWLASDPTPEQMQEVYKELSSKDKGAAKALREKLEELRRAKGQEAVAAEWEAKGQALLQAARLNIADSLAWQRDAAKAGAPLSREPLAGLRAQLVDRIKKVEDLQQRVMVQREAAVMLSQRIELLSTKPLADAQAQQTGLASDVEQWRSHARLLLADPQWLSVDVRYPPQLEAAQTQLLAVRDAFVAALDQAAAAAQDKSAPLPSVPVWADELRAARGEPPAAAAVAEEAGAKAAPKPRVDPEQRNAAQKAVEAGVKLLEQAVAAGHTKNMHSATAALRQSLKAHGRLIDDALEARVHATLVSAGELEGWQRWSADKVREQLVAQAEALLTKRKIKGTQGASAAANARANEATTATEEAGAMQAAAAQDAHAPEVSTDNAAEGAEAPADPEGAVAEPSPNAQANAATTASEEAGAREEAAAETAATESEATAVGSTSAAGQSGAESAVAEDAISANAQANEATTATEQAGAMEEAAAERSQRPVRPSPADTLEPGYELVPAMGGRKLQDTIRKLRDEWKAADQGGAPNHALWKRFDRAINAAHKHVDEWLGKVRAEAAEHKAQRQALIDEVKAFGAAHAGDGEGADWKAFNRQIHQFSDRWRNAGHLSEKAFAELQGKWKEAIHAAAAPLETAQKHSTARRQGLITEAEALGAAAQLRIDAVRSLQQRWQAEAQAVPLERKHEQRLWDAFRKPLDEAFNRKGAEREKQQAAMSAHDRAVLDAAKALEEANASGDANRIRSAMAALEAATRAQPAPAAAEAPKAEEKSAAAPADAALAATESAAPADGSAEASATDGETAEGADVAAAPAPAAPPKPAKPVVAMRGDDRPGAKRPEAAPAGRGGKFGDRRDGRPGPGGRDARGGPGAGGRGGERFGDRGPREDRGPRLGDAAFRAQRDAVEHAQAQLRKLAAQAHGETVTQLIGAWAARQPEQLPSAQELGKGVSGSTRTAWAQAVQSAPQGSASEALLRLEMAADVPTPADQLDARRALQLKLLTRRNDPSPAETWANDAGAVLGTAHDEATARRLQNALKVLMRK
ncbi:DUF349 domain-containing protein [Ottowia oryzae]